MVDIKGFTAIRPTNPEDFTTNPYDVISQEELEELRKNPKSVVHIILPTGEGQEAYENARQVLQKDIDQGVLIQDKKESIYLYRQESEEFTQEGFILAVSLEDYEQGAVKRHEYTGKKHLEDRINHIAATQMNTGLVWMVYKRNEMVEHLSEEIKEEDPIYDFTKYGYRHVVWKSSEISLVQKIKSLFEPMPLYIADGHHRTESAAEYRRRQLKKIEEDPDLDADPDANWQYFMGYVASDHQVNLLAYNRAVKKLPMKPDELIDSLRKKFVVEVLPTPRTPEKKHEICLYVDEKWYTLKPLEENFESIYDSLDAVILQKEVFAPLFGVENPRETENLVFVGGDVRTAEDQEKYVQKHGYESFFSLSPVDIRDMERIADEGGVMPPKSTWFSPKVLTGLTFHSLK